MLVAQKETPKTEHKFENGKCSVCGAADPDYKPELNYSKDEILELYLNTIYFGSGYYGIKEASEGYFGKEPAMLALPESAMLAGIPNAPSLYSPYVDFMLAKKRQFIVLDAMTAAGYLRESVADDAKIKPIYLAH